MGNSLKQLLHKHNGLLLLVGIATILRLLLASSIELGNDEVYYWTYVKYPDISHFDHPPMLGYLAQLFTLNLSFDSELALRLSAVFSGILSTILIYAIAYKLNGQRAAIYAALLFTASLYSSIISSLFLMPDNPLVVFWLWSIYLIVSIIKQDELNHNKMLLLGISFGLALLSKYQAIFLPFGFLITLVIHRRECLTKPSLTFSFFLAALIASPIIWWNFSNDFVSFGFHSTRVGFFDKGIRFDYFLSELVGEVFYNNPIVFALIIVALFNWRKVQLKLDPRLTSTLLNLSWPLISIVLVLALFRRTLPHWTGPAYLSLMIFAAVYLSQIKFVVARRWLVAAVSLTFFISQIGAFEINHGFLTHTFQKPTLEAEKVGKYDVTLDMFGWKAFKEKFEAYLSKQSGIVSDDLPIISQDLYQSAHLDYYVARPLGRKLISFGPLKDIHKYAWINKERGYLESNSDAYFITHSRAFKSVELFRPHFKKIELLQIIPIYRKKHLAQNFFVYKLIDYQGNYDFPIVKD